MEGTEVSLMQQQQYDAYRVVVQIKTENVPGKPLQRHKIVANAFMSQFLRRNYLADTDYIHIPCDIDREKAKCFVVLDINVKNQRTKPLEQVPLYCYTANFSNERAM